MDHGAPPEDDRIPGSFRDPSGFLYRRDGVLLRQVNPCYRADYEALHGSGLAQELVERGLLVRSEEVGLELAHTPPAFRVLRPVVVPFVSYPYEWSFGMARAAALTTLEVQQRALARGMTLKDASAYNIQFVEGRPLLIDSLSFERSRDGAPWVAYRQFCQHFLAPLALMRWRDLRLGQLLRTHLDGVPLDLASALLPPSTWLRPGLLVHLHLHARAQTRYAARPVSSDRLPKMTRQALLGLLDSLDSNVRAMAPPAVSTEWADYEETHNYGASALESKKALVGRFLDDLAPAPRTVWDLGANTGLFSRLAADRGATVISLDSDPVAVDTNYRRVCRDGATRIHPLLMDLTNPSPGLGWASTERSSLAERGPADCVLALALVHHLAISNNVPLPRVASYLARLGASLVVEFVPKDDPQVGRLLASREDVFPGYTREGFETAFSSYYETRRCEGVEGTGRSLYLMLRKDRRKPS